MANPALKLGSTGRAVKRMQALLAGQGYTVGPVDGDFGEMTLAAVVQFQMAHVGSSGTPLDPDGVVGSQTWWALVNASGASQGGSVPTPPVPADAERARILGIARAELGTKEDPDGSNGGPRVDVYTGAWRVPWCALFVSWVLRQLPDGSPFGERPLAAVRRIRDWGIDNNRYHSDPFSPGPADVFIMMKKGLDGVDTGHGHTGFVADALPETIVTVEGNCANAVRSRERQRSTISGYVRVVS
jgi:putative peptidoglycan binding protein/CHAP domain-containing protein